MQNEIINSSGWISTFLAIGFNLINWMAKINFNQYITVIISVLSAVFLSMKIYDQYLITKERKRIKNYKK